MEKTTDYGIFKFMEANRGISQKLVNDLVLSIQRVNLLEYRPLLVNERMDVIDGQHRLKAAEKLGVPVYYEKTKGMSTKEIIALQIQTRWTWADFMNAFVKDGNENYLKLNNFINQYEIPIPIAMDLFDCSSREKENGKKYKSGEFIYPKDDKTQRLKVELFIETCDYIKKFSAGGLDLKNKKSFSQAFVRFVNIDEVNYLIFQKKLKARMDKIRKCITSFDYFRLLVSVYNFKNTNPLMVDTSGYVD